MTKPYPKPGTVRPLDPDFGEEVSLFDAAEAIRKRDAAIQKIEESASYRWKTTVMEALLFLAEQREELTSDDLLAYLGDEGTDVHDLRALGPMFLAASRKKWIRASDRFVLCQRPSRHGAPIRVWESLILQHRDGVGRS